VFGLFSKSKSIVEPEQAEWIQANYDWLDKHVGFPDDVTPLITPTDQFFTRPLTKAMNVRFMSSKRLRD